MEARCTIVCYLSSFRCGGLPAKNVPLRNEMCKQQVATVCLAYLGAMLIKLLAIEFYQELISIKSKDLLVIEIDTL